MSLSREILSPVTTAGLLCESKSKPRWNKGKTQETHPSIKKMADAKRGKKNSPETIKKKSEGIKRRNSKPYKQPILRKCSVCGKEIACIDYYSMNRHMFKEHNPMKDPEILKRNNPTEHLREINEGYAQGIFPEGWKEKGVAGKKRHDDAIEVQEEVLKEQGFRVIRIGKMEDIKPDLIAIKDGKVYAIEVELSKPDYDKYNGITYFDDIIWVLIDKSSSRAKSRAAHARLADSHA